MSTSPPPALHPATQHLICGLYAPPNGVLVTVHPATLDAGWTVSFNGAQHPVQWHRLRLLTPDAIVNGHLLNRGDEWEDSTRQFPAAAYPVAHYLRTPFSFQRTVQRLLRHHSATRTRIQELEAVLASSGPQDFRASGPLGTVSWPASPGRVDLLIEERGGLKVWPVQHGRYLSAEQCAQFWASIGDEEFGRMSAAIGNVFYPGDHEQAVIWWTGA